MQSAGAMASSERGEVMKIIVYGSPAPQGSKKFVGHAKSTGRAIMVESSKKVRPWRQDVKAAGEAVRNGAPALDGALVVRMVFTLPKPASAPKRKRLYAMRKPDLSKLVRSVEDALVDAGVITDDARIVEYQRLAKVFPREDPEALEAPGVIIVIQRLVEEAIDTPALRSLFDSTEYAA
jgi:Holliday junction resolvase RusA-like endonuclease